MEERRNFEDLWKEPFIVGAHWDEIPRIYQHNWDFRNLENAFEEGGVLHGRRVYIFACIEAPESTLIHVIVALVSPFPPSNMIGITSVQMDGEQIIPMKRMKMDWVPYVPLENRGTKVENLNSEIFVLKCTQRRSALRNMKEDRFRTFEYSLPYFYNPFEEEVEQDTEVTIVYDMDPHPVVCQFDWELDELEEFVQGQTDVPSDHKVAFKEFIRERVREAKRANREAREARINALEEMNEETRDALQSMRFYKFYPARTPDGLAVKKAHFINRYFGKAHGIF